MKIASDPVRRDGVRSFANTHPRRRAGMPRIANGCMERRAEARLNPGVQAFPRCSEREAAFASVAIAAAYLFPFRRNPSMPALRPAVVGLLATLLLGGCQRAVFAFVNRGVPPPEATVEFAPDRGLSLDVYRPRTGDGRAPVVVFFYGGSWQTGAREGYRFVGQRLAEHGVLVVIPDYRKAPLPSFPGFMDDAARAVAWARAHAREWGGDPDRVFIAGHSAGAQIAALLGTDARYLRAHGVGSGAVAGVVGLSGPYDFVISGDLRNVFGAPSQWPRAQAVNFVDGDEPPFLLVHGTGDRVVDSVDSEQLAQRLRERRVPVRLLMLPDAGHLATVAGLYQAERAPEVLPAMLEFLRAPAAGAASAR